MSAGMPELGSKISLISKADIRYEGRLFTVDPTECTIALASVRSFGTEDRDTSYPIMPQPTVYDYILFRGSDIKDIRVVNSVAIPNDPAIMQMHLPQHQPSFAGNTGNQFPPMQGSPMSQFNAFGLQSGNMSSLGQVAAVMKQNQQAQEQQSQSPIQQQQGKTSKKNLAPASGQKNKKSSELSNGIDVTSMDKSKTTTRKQSNKSQDSRSGTPNLSRKSPVSDRGHQANQNQRDNQAGNKENSRQGPRNNQQRNNNQQQPRERRDSGRNEVQEVRGDKGGYRNRPNNNGMNNHPQQPQHQQQQQRGYNNNRNNNYNGNNNNQMRGNNQGGSARMRGPPMHMNNYRQHANQGTPNQNQNNNNKPTNGQQTQRKPLKFENEFDFDEANSKFEELRANLARLKVRATEEPQPTEQVNGEVEKKDDSGNETSADPEDANGYDKNKSFFDNISCEAVERSKGKTQRTNWREERKINSETFGYTFNRRGNFRGRGGYYQNSYNRGPRPGGYRGGNQNYRPVRNLRNQNIVEGRPNAPASNGQQSQTMAAVVAAN